MSHAPLYSYTHGINAIFIGDTIFSPSVALTAFRGDYESIEHEHIGVTDGTTIMVKKFKNNNICTHFVTTKIDVGYVRRTIIFREDEPDPFPATIDNQIYLSL